jgi:nucleotide-binding universal stress UspA family protein
MSDMAVYPTVVVGTDGSETAARAARSAALLTERLGVELLIAAAYQRIRAEHLGTPSDLAGAGEDVISGAYRGAAETAEDTCAQATRGLNVKVDTAAVEGAPADALLDLAENHPGCLLVVGNKGMTDSARFLLGNVPNKISHHPVGDILIVQTGEDVEPRLPARLLVGTDGSVTAMRAVDRAVELAAGIGARLTVLSAGQPEQVEKAIAAAGERAEAAGVPWEGAPRDGDPATCIVEASEEHDLTVVGNRGMTGTARFLLGSVPNKVSHHIASDLLIVKTDKA